MFFQISTILIDITRFFLFSGVLLKIKTILYKNIKYIIHCVIYNIFTLQEKHDFVTDKFITNLKNKSDAIKCVTKETMTD